MPQLFRIGKYIVYFWSNENRPLEPVHVHIAEGEPVQNATKVWITQDGHSLLCNNNSKIARQDLKLLLRMIEANSKMIIEKWSEHFETISFYC